MGRYLGRKLSFTSHFCCSNLNWAVRALHQEIDQHLLSRFTVLEGGHKSSSFFVKTFGIDQPYPAILRVLAFAVRRRLRNQY